MPFRVINALCNVLGEQEKRRLELIAPLFDIDFRKLALLGYRIEVRDGATVRSADVGETLAHVRLLTEICEKTLNWVYFRGQEHCALTLLSLTDSKIQRIAQLYRLRQGGLASAADFG